MQGPGKREKKRGGNGEEVVRSCRALQAIGAPPSKLDHTFSSLSEDVGAIFQFAPLARYRLDNMKSIEAR